VIGEIINPSCLSVNNAVIFFMSFSYIALILVITDVDMPMIIIVEDRTI